MVDAWIWARAPKDVPQVKESTRWVEGYEIVADLAERVPETRLVYVADREGDLRALMDAAARRGTPADWLVRAQPNRNTTTGEKLWDRLARSEPLGEVEFLLPAAPDRPARLRAANAVPASGDAAGASRRTGGDRDGDPGPRGTPAGGRDGDRMATADQPDGRDARSRGGTH